MKKHEPVMIMCKQISIINLLVVPLEKNKLGKVKRYLYVDDMGLGNSKKHQKQVIKILSKYTIISKKDITIDSRLREDLGINSLDYVSIVSDLEDLYSIKIDIWQSQKEVATVKDIINYILNLKKH